MPTNHSDFIFCGALAAIANIAGDDAALEVAHSYNATGLWLGETITKKCRLVEIVGLDKAEEIRQRLGPGNHYIQSVGSITAKRKKSLIISAKGESAEVSRRFKCSRRYVNKIRKDCGL